MALTAKRIVEFEGQPEKASALLHESDVYYRGAILVLDGADGYAKVPSNGAGLQGAGILTGRYEGGVEDYEYSVGASDHPRAELLVGKVWLPFSGAAQTDVGDVAYLADDADLTKTAGSKTVMYRILDFKTGYLLIDLRRPFM